MKEIVEHLAGAKDHFPYLVAAHQRVLEKMCVGGIVGNDDEGT